MSKPTIMPAYATPILHTVLEDCEATNAGLKELILSRADPNPTAVRSNIGGWHSENDLLNWDSAHVTRLLKWFQSGITTLTQATGGVEDAKEGEFFLAAWANVLYKGGYNRVHDHFGYIWSGVYYVDAGDPTPEHEYAGVLEFIEPRTAVTWPYMPGQPFRHPVRVTPTSGQLVMFPSWLLHHVHPYQGERPRISIAFNAAFKFSGQEKL